MSTSYRITVNEIDRSASLLPDVGNTGGMVVRSSRGPREPIRISPGQNQRLFDLFGEISTSYPDVWEAYQYIQNAPLWAVTPSDTTSDTQSAIVVESTGALGYYSASPTSSLQSSSGGLTPTSIDAFTFSASTQYFVLYSKIPSTSDFLRTSVSYNSLKDAFNIILYILRDGAYEVYDEYTVSITEGATGDFGSNIYIEDVFAENDLIGVIVNDTAGVAGDTSNEFVDSTEVDFTGSAKSISMSTLLTTAWAYFQSSRKYPVTIFMDTTADSSIPAIFNTMRNTYQTRSFYIMPLPLTEGSSAAISTKAGYSSNNRGIAYYWNQAKVQYGTKKFWTSLIGPIGVRHALMVDVFNGLAPSWINEGNHGGQLGSIGVLEMKFDPTQTELEALDDVNINPLVFDPNFGVMITSQKTAKTPGFISDDSYIGHSRLFDVIIANIQTQILVPQITKLNDELHRRQAALLGGSFLQSIVDKGLLSSYKVVCDTSNNTGAVLSRREFVYTVEVRVTPFSESVQFNFVKLSQLS